MRLQHIFHIAIVLLGFLLLPGCKMTSLAQEPSAKWTFEGEQPFSDQISAKKLIDVAPSAHLQKEAQNTALELENSEKADKILLPTSLPDAFTLVFWLKPNLTEKGLNFFLFSSDNLVIRFEEQKLFFVTRIEDSKQSIHQDVMTLALDQQGPRSSSYFFDGAWHHFVFKYDAKSGKKEIWIDGISPEGASKIVSTRGKLCEINRNQLGFSGDAKRNRHFVGLVDEVTIYPTFLNSAVHVTSFNHSPFAEQIKLNARNIPQAPSTASSNLDLREYPSSKVLPSPVEQLQQYPAPRYYPGHSLRPLISWMNFRFMGEEPRKGVDQATAIRNSVDIQRELALNWHYTIDLGNARGAGALMEGKSGSFIEAWIELANEYPEIPVSLKTLWAQTNLKRVGDDNRKPFIMRKTLSDEMYLRNAKGQFLDQQGAISKRPSRHSPAGNLNMYKIDGRAQAVHLQAIIQRLNHPIYLINENGEVPFKRFRPEVLEKDPRVVSQKERLGMDDWEVYQSNRKLALRQTYRDMFMKKFPSLQNTHFAWYAVDGGPSPQFRFAWDPSREIHYPINGMYYSTMDFYPRWPDNWKKWKGAWRGWEWVEICRQEEIAHKDYLCSPFIGAGWSGDPSKNIRPSQWLGLLKHLGVVGSEFFYVGFFNLETGDKYADPRNWAWQAAAPAYAQAITSRYESILREGSLVMGGPDRIAHYVSAPGGLVTIRKHAQKPVYIIAANINPVSNIKGNIPDLFPISLFIEKDTVKLIARKQGSVYVYDASGAKPIVYQLDSWHEIGHFSRWSKNIELEAEVYDEGEGVTRTTEVPSGANRGDYTEFISGIQKQAGAQKMEVSYHFQPRDIATWELSLHLKTQSKQAGKVSIWLDGKLISNWGCVKEKDWEWIERDPCSKQKVRLPNLEAGDHVLTIITESNDLTIDKILLTHLNN